MATAELTRGERVQQREREGEREGESEQLTTGRGAGGERGAATVAVMFLRAAT